MSTGNTTGELSLFRGMAFEAPIPNTEPKVVAKFDCSMCGRGPASGASKAAVATCTRVIMAYGLAGSRGALQLCSPICAPWPTLSALPAWLGPVFGCAPRAAESRTRTRFACPRSCQYQARRK